MKNITLLILLFFISWMSVGQIDTIYTFRKTIPCTITKVSELTVEYLQNNEEKFIARDRIKRLAIYSYDLPSTKLKKFKAAIKDKKIECKTEVKVHTSPVYAESWTDFEILQGKLFPILAIDFYKRMDINDTSYIMDLVYHEQAKKNSNDTNQLSATDLDTMLCYESTLAGISCLKDFEFFPNVIYYDDRAKTDGIDLVIDLITQDYDRVIKRGVSRAVYNTAFSTVGYFYEPHYRVKLTPRELNAFINLEVSAFRISQFERRLTNEEIIRLRDVLLCLVKTTN